MKTVHTFGIAILLAVAAALGVAAARPAGGSHAQAAGSSPAAATAMPTAADCLTCHPADACRSCHGSCTFRA